MAAVVLWAGIAAAAEAPQVGPTPEWVQAAPAVPAETDAAKALPVAILLNDTQVSIEASGWTEFHRIRARVQSPVGLQALSALPFQWSPWSDTLIFHGASIERGDQSIDILPKDGGFTVLRRETGLPNARCSRACSRRCCSRTGCRVGDVLEVTVSIRHADPLLKGSRRVGFRQLGRRADRAPTAGGALAFPRCRSAGEKARACRRSSGAKPMGSRGSRWIWRMSTRRCFPSTRQRVFYTAGRSSLHHLRRLE